MITKLRKSMSLAVAIVAVSIGTLFCNIMEVSAEQIDESTISINYANQKMTVGKSSNSEIIFGVSTVKVDKNTGKSIISTPSWDVYENAANGVTIDLSFLNNAKDNYIQVMGELQNEPITIKIPAVDKKLKASFNALTGKVSITDNNAKSLPESTEYEYRTQNGGWQDYLLSDELSLYQKRGAVLYFRTKPSKTGSLNDYKATEVFTDENGDNVSVKTAGKFPGKELKVKISKLSKAPKIKLNYENRTLTIPKGVLYRFLALHGNGKYYISSAWAESDGNPMRYEYEFDSKHSSITEPRYWKQRFFSGNVIVETKTKANDKKPSSSIGRLTTKSNGVSGVGYTAYKDNFPYSIGMDSSVQGKNPYFEVIVKSEKKVSKGKTTYTLTFTNKGTHVYQIAFRNTPELSDNLKTKTIAAASGAGQTKVTKITGIKEGQYVYFRVPGNNKLKLWASEFYDLGQIREN